MHNKDTHAERARERLLDFSCFFEGFGFALRLARDGDAVGLVELVYVPQRQSIAERVFWPRQPTVIDHDLDGARG
jgi:hypothetical protein